MQTVACHCTRARRVARALTALYDAALSPSGLKVTQFSLMRAISRLQSPAIGRLAQETGLERSTLGRNLRVLERAGLVRLGAGADERTRLVTLTDAATAALSRAEPLWHRAQTEAETLLSADMLAALDAASERLAAPVASERPASKPRAPGR